MTSPTATIRNAVTRRAAELGIAIPPERLDDIAAGAKQLADSVERIRVFLNTRGMDPPTP